MLKKIWNYLKKDKPLWIAALPVAIFMFLIWLPIILDDVLSEFKLYILPPVIKIFLQKIKAITIVLAPIIVYTAFSLFWKFVKDRTQELDKRTEQADQNIIRLIEGTGIVRNELDRLLGWADTISFFGPLDDNNGFSDILISKQAEKEIQIFDTYINNKTKFNELLKANINDNFHYNFCLYKQIIGTVIGYKDGNNKQLLFFKDADSNELKGIILNKNINIYKKHLEDDLKKGVGPAIDFKNQVTNIRTTLDETLQNFWKSMNIGWTHPVMPPKCDNSPWEHEILSFFHHTALTIAGDERTKKIVITWRVMEKALSQAENIEVWFDYLKTTFIKKGNIERIILIDKNKFDTVPDYKNIVLEIHSKYFSSLPSNYSIEYRNLSSGINSDGYDFALFYNEENKIIAIQGSTYDRNHEELLRIYFARDIETQKQYLRKYDAIRLQQIIPTLQIK